LEERGRTEDQKFAGDNVLIYFDEQASLLAASAKDAEVSELQRKLKLADDEIDRINKRFDEAQGMLLNVS
jgi:hypothetical protein